MNNKTIALLTWMLFLVTGMALTASDGVVYASLRESPTLPLGSGLAADTAPTVVGSVLLASASEGMADIAVKVINASKPANPDGGRSHINPSTNRLYIYDGLHNRNIRVYDSLDSSPKATVYNCRAGFDLAINLIYSASQCGNDNDLLQVLVNYVSGNCAEKESQFDGGRGGES